MVVARIWVVLVILAAFALQPLVTAPALAGASVSAAVQTVSNPAGFSLLAPAAWHAGTVAPSGSLKQWLVSPDGKEALKVSAATQTIQSSDVGTFVTLFIGNISGSNPDLGSPQSVTIPGAGAATEQTLRYTDASGNRMVETVLAAATGTTLYVLELVTPDSFAGQNAALIQTVLSSLQVGSG
jgi:hypothetical protein